MGASDRALVDLDALATIEAKATPGPWRGDGSGECCGVSTVWTLERPSQSVTSYCNENDRDFIVAVRDVLPHLIAEVRFRREGMRVMEETARRADEWLAAAEKVVEAASRFVNLALVLDNDVHSADVRDRLLVALVAWDRAKETT